MPRFRIITAFNRGLLTIGLLLAAPALAGEAEECSVCRKRLPMRHWIYDGQSVCSRPCMEERMPQCSTCRKRIDSHHLSSNGKSYCSEACFEKTLNRCEICRAPVHTGFTYARHTYCTECTESAPTCFSCGLPAAWPTQLDDGRAICAPCMRWAIDTDQEARMQYDRARRHLETWTGLKFQSIPKLELVDLTRMQRLSHRIRKSDSPVSIRGLYSRQVAVTRKKIFGLWQEEQREETETIFIVDHLRDEVFRVAAVHELMHDLIHEQFPQMEKAPLWVHEGICQQAAAEYGRRRNYLDVLQGIEDCVDPDYGDGYRYFNRMAEFEGWAAIRRWMESVDPSTLPDEPPR